jgi:hypothetical protein
MMRVVLRGAALSVAPAAASFGASAGPVSAAATTMPADQLGPIYPSPLPSSALPSSGPGVTIVGNCPAFPFTDPVGFQFTSGSAVFFGSATNPKTNGRSIEGTATLLDDSNPTTYSGHTTLWFGQNTNPTGNLQQHFGETISFSGSGPDGSIIITAYLGATTSASGNESGRGRLKVTCS